MDIQKQLAQRTHAVEWSGIRVMFALADEIEGVVNLGIGQPGRVIIRHLNVVGELMNRSIHHTTFHRAALISQIPKVGSARNPPIQNRCTGIGHLTNRNSGQLLGMGLNERAGHGNRGGNPGHGCAGERDGDFMTHRLQHNSG